MTTKAPQTAASVTAGTAATAATATAVAQAATAAKPAASPAPAPRRHRMLTGAAVVLALVTLGAVFLLYWRPEMAFDMATRLWSCF